MCNVIISLRPCLSTLHGIHPIVLSLEISRHSAIGLRLLLQLQVALGNTTVDFIDLAAVFLVVQQLPAHVLRLTFPGLKIRSLLGPIVVLVGGLLTGPLVDIGALQALPRADVSLQFLLIEALAGLPIGAKLLHRAQPSVSANVVLQGINLRLPLETPALLDEAAGLHSVLVGFPPGAAQLLQLPFLLFDGALEIDLTLYGLALHGLALSDVRRVVALPLQQDVVQHLAGSGGVHG